MPSIAFVVFDQFQSMSLAAQSVFEFANYVQNENYYKVITISPSGGLIQSSSKISIMTDAFDETIFDTIIFAGNYEGSTGIPDSVIEYAKKSINSSRRIAAICTGSYVLATAHLLDHRKATTHWHYASDLQTRFPLITVDIDRIFMIDGNIWTSAGMTAGIDLALEMVEQDLGGDIARKVAQKLVMYHRRAGGQSQHSELLDLNPKSDRIQTALTYAKKNLASNLSVEHLAEIVNLSSRQFSRIFTAETGQTPAKAIESLRIESARLLLEQGRLSLEQIANETGFKDTRHMREVFLRTLAQPPQVIRRNARN
ncbi:GlxA family transcriptional regulator [Acinetobacter baumannii]|uniref:GlxA family transcriptional regulator n=1 Tax=Acinetobacter calcoaceticus/baumannii complex TaxID=909768 RepID=UPI000837D4BD|nr:MULTISPECIES: GlxA family transcriptional regulator [Acinetobacter calcoaceticus/baumannii complex]MDH2526512.1 GlxA family transcriptional regulator [Acinetobacter baumannii]MDV7432863.1 GlxA family transcriptional regulator [Acinetobacter baumannii]MDV8153829.1 GlxA family transcriptional regulator [Acinetobacter pittii]OCY54578.1 AraC family transcriptional regulator [Acinetobacter pittii]HCW3749190.1 GlxA family transcriptional regulator [Acinetobacter baumannii]